MGRGGILLKIRPNVNPVDLRTLLRKSTFVRSVKGVAFIYGTVICLITYVQDFVGGPKSGYFFCRPVLQYSQK